MRRSIAVAGWLDGTSKAGSAMALTAPTDVWTPAGLFRFGAFGLRPGGHLPVVDMRLPHSEIVVESERVAPALILVDGWAYAYRMLPDGRRQIFDFLLPGDLLCPELRLDGTAATSVHIITRAGTVDATGHLDDAQCAGLLAQLRGEATQRRLEHIVRLGRQTAAERMGHLMLDLYARSKQAGLALRARFAMPLTQELIADALGLSIVHVSRVLQQLRRDRLIERDGGILVLLDPDRLAAITDQQAGCPGRLGQEW